jgi:ribulose-5-phosphate 4-epimerase/fuculose-1-phosphate aldolase
MPPVYEQMGAQADDAEIVVYNEYTTGVHEATSAARNAEAVGTANFALLGHHGVLVLAPDVVTAHHRAVTLERRCRMGWYVEQLGGGPVMPRPAVNAVLEARRELGGFPELWEWAVRRELSLDGTVLD